LLISTLRLSQPQSCHASVFLTGLYDPCHQTSRLPIPCAGRGAKVHACNTHSCYTGMSLVSLNLSLSCSSQPLVLISASQPVLKFVLFWQVLPPTFMGPATETSWLSSSCAGRCSVEVHSHSTHLRHTVISFNHFNPITCICPYTSWFPSPWTGRDTIVRSLNLPP